MSDTKTIDQCQSGRSRAYQRLTPQTAVLLLIDAFARAARVLGVPVVLTSTARAHDVGPDSA